MNRSPTKHVHPAPHINRAPVVATLKKDLTLNGAVLRDSHALDKVAMRSAVSALEGLPRLHGGVSELNRVVHALGSDAGGDLAEKWHAQSSLKAHVAQTSARILIRPSSSVHVIF